jgi:hypothetical protein
MTAGLTEEQKLGIWTNRHGMSYLPVPDGRVAVRCRCGWGAAGPTAEAAEASGQGHLDVVSVRLWGRPGGPPEASPEGS